MNEGQRSAEAAQAAQDVLTGAYRSLFLLAGWIRDGQVSGPRTLALRSFAEGALREQRRELLRAGLDEDLVADAQVAIIALLDESANSCPVRDFAEQWQRESLQYAHYQHNHLGRDFFERLEYWQKRPDTSLALLELYTRCLAWGFEGRYREENRPADLKVLRETLHNELQRRRGLPPQLGSPLDELAKLPPPPLLVTAPWVLGIAATLILACGLVLSMLLYWQAATVTRALRAGDHPDPDNQTTARSSIP